MDRSVISDPKSHYGSGKLATRHFITQRLTGALNILFTIFFIWLVVSLAGAERAEMLAVVGNPFVAILSALLVVNVCVHMRIGMQEVIEDYVVEPRLHSLTMLLNNLFCLAIALIGVIAIAKIAIWG
ncbi:succinate dehydrogenase, hydrophobic membrane anchor protein [Paradevosia shaoguanensis]|jgi:succinate dehydrogenase / fumarate reductase membrane anchor subunit|uniref:Succinate dehydrogenase hydrophobic membrane anchor subunit n=1 Tax=Paradevosia shaoguanensis TaxID=1335043 RepID=A0AA41QPI4_9HYPH|nr:succinate dehydrogenase, hydrophobic membrane anchor protein [Paradevosia shaoguanensis]MCF1743817.1 succinate dehydrogenase, hydrophobic membrane anchor protein [Paradevosia shaoguanensis]MCI0128300.1 succinate dehydrogenase, hydrophobic membrane anchor protein [Paradevosia shaoguanensis]